MEVERLAIPDVLLLRPRVFTDERGRFFESWSRERYREAGIDGDFSQDNVSVSAHRVLRGLHAQAAPFAQGKLVTVLKGAIFDVVVDVRPNSLTFGRWLGVELLSGAGTQLWVPPGFLHGFQALEDESIVHYKCTIEYNNAVEFSVRWNDPVIGVKWPIGSPILSPKDTKAPFLENIKPELLVGFSK